MTNKQYRYLLKKISSRYFNIIRAGFYSPAFVSYFEHGYDLEYKSDLEERKKQIDELLYINDLKTSRFYGAKKYTLKYKKIFENINNSIYSKEIYDIFNKLVNDKLIYNQYKYEIFNTINEMIYDCTEEEIISHIKNKYFGEVEYIEKIFNPTILF